MNFGQSSHNLKEGCCLPSSPKPYVLGLYETQSHTGRLSRSDRRRAIFAKGHRGPRQDHHLLTASKRRPSLLRGEVIFVDTIPLARGANEPGRIHGV